MKPEEETRIILGDISESITDLNRTLENINSNLAKLVEKVHEVGNVGSCIFEIMDRN